MLLTRRLVVVITAALAAGCGGSANSTFSFVGARLQPASGGNASAALAFREPEARGERKDLVNEAADPQGPNPPPPPAAGGAPPDAVRQIIYTADVDVVVDDLDRAAAELLKLVDAHKGYVSKSMTTGTAGSARSATYTVRVPVANFPALRAALAKLGSAERDGVKSDDVTEEFYDVTARVKNLKEQEAKLNELLKEKRQAEKLEDIIRVSDRIAEVRRDVERAEGRLRYLKDFAALSTVNVSLREVKDYRPPTAPTFSNRIGRAWSNSIDGLVEFGENVVIAAVAVGPWLPVLIPLGLAGLWVARRLVRRAAPGRAGGVSPPSPPPPDGSRESPGGP